ncbi:MAG: nitronate monooxygenase [Sterolibacterium sp.]|nr:nitronate monooxygenase [Sterolibacterium sp.]MBP9799705.1 nitronate monooxygenase [Sterolibacterium sp.]
MARKDPLRTKLCDMLGIEYPIVAFTHCKDVAAAVINSGAFAVLGQTQSTPEEIEANVRWLKERIGDKPFGIDLVFPASVPAKCSIDEMLAGIPREQQDYANDIARRYNIPEPKKTPELYDLGWMEKEKSHKQLEVALELKVPVLASGLGNPDFFIPAAHARGMQVWGLVGKQRQAKKELEAGVDVIVAQGMDAAGHTGNVGTFSIVPQVRAIAGDVPVIAAGGVTTGRHLAGAIGLGASGVWTGTLWLASRESDVDMRMKERLIEATSDDTSYSACVSGFTMRTLMSKWHEEWAKPGAPKPAPAPYQLLLFAKMKQSAFDWDMKEFMTEAAGQGVGFIDSMKPCRKIVSDMVDEAYEAFTEIYGELD